VPDVLFEATEPDLFRSIRDNHVGATLPDYGYLADIRIQAAPAGGRSES
jgi:hypothetical protein